MKASEPSATRLVCIFLLGCLLLQFPMIAVFNVSGRILGVPILFAYLFTAWAVVILLVALVAERRS